MTVEPSRVETQQAQLEAIRRLRGGHAPTVRPVIYAGFVTRAIAITADAAIIWAVAAAVGVSIGLCVSLLHLPQAADAAIAAVLGTLGILWSIAYFVFFWSSTGQTFGSRLMAIQVVDSRARGPLKPRRALMRLGGLVLGMLALGLGLVMMLWDPRGRCLQDRLARTVVVNVAAEE